MKHLRKIAGLTQNQLTHRIGVSQAYISRLEHGYFEGLSIDKLLRISKALKVCPWALFIIFTNIRCNKNCFIIYKQIFFYSHCTSRRLTVYTLHDGNCKISSWGDFMPGEKFTIYMDEDLKKELKKIAIDENKSSSEIISELVKEYISNKKKVNK